MKAMVGVNVAAAVLCGAVMYAGTQHWQEQTEAQASEVKTAVIHKEKQFSDVSAYTKNLPDFITKQIQSSIANKKPLTLVLATSAKEAEWPQQLKKELEATYGSDVFTVKTLSYGSQTTGELLSSHIADQINQLQPNIILFEAPLKNDYQKLTLDDTLKNTEELIHELKDLKKTLMLQPSQPYISQTESYEEGVEAIRGVAEENWVHYLNHSLIWPFHLGEYVNKNDGRLTKKGGEVWGDYLVHWFTSKK
ncbi:SGNH/GDSL hydrolase family protein [Priestia aryabhattai]|uniref:SGNH/GDSL hydrolase family protein n=1 Tax=Priestia aryabhattai TaxID=412384 RepID=UPI001CC9CC8A|nr:SGNH/GDSL hydrolase family protein [Priestia aryabhattai]MBZ6489079.1 SGNH/GDSL hydrolase family protein [Priestia aryabhattai]